ncbi:MAG: hypothetical protein IK134_04860 [Oscillospiraceae bacterium]|nr:hypothetical protein [Oscillospiraceae bacterium]
MKKLSIGIITGVLLCGMLTAPVSAEEIIPQMGDVNLDGTVNIADAQLILRDYVEVMCQLDGSLTKEQRALGNVDGKTEKFPDSIEFIASVSDAEFVLIYYCAHLVDPTVTMESVVGRELKSDAALVAFNEKYRIEQNPETGVLEAVLRDQT